MSTPAENRFYVRSEMKGHGALEGKIGIAKVGVPTEERAKELVAQHKAAGVNADYIPIPETEG